MGIKELSLQEFIDTIHLKMTDSSPHKVCFVLGAGASVSSGIKSGQQLVKLWDEELSAMNEVEHTKWKKELGITDDNKSEFYSKYFEHRFKSKEDGHKYLENLMNGAKPGTGYYFLSYVLSRTNNKVVVTTNFDRLIEQAVSRFMNTQPLVIGHEVLANFVPTEIRRPTILKIHHDFLMDPMNTTEQLEALPDNWKELLNKIFSVYHPVFIGYAGNDNSLMDYLQQNSYHFRNGNWLQPYWLQFANDSIGDKVLSLLSASNGILVKHDSFDKVMSKLAVKLGFRMPTEAIFFKEDKAIYEEIGLAINAPLGKSIKDSDSLDTLSAILDLVADIMKAIDLIKDLKTHISFPTSNNQRKSSKTIRRNQHLVKRQPNNAQLRYNLAVDLYHANQYPEAILELKKAVELDPKQGKYHYALGLTLHYVNQNNLALTELQTAVNLCPSNADYYIALGDTLQALGRYQEAILQKQKAIGLKPDISEYRHSIGDTYNNMGRFEEALIAIKYALKLDPNNAVYHASYGTVLHELSRFEEAITEKRKATDLAPNNADFHYQLSDTLSTIGLYQDAIKEIYRAIQLNPGNATYYDGLGQILRKTAQYGDAVNMFQRAIKIEPSNPLHHQRLGTTLCTIGKYDEALMELNKALALDPKNAEHQFFIGHILYSMGKHEDAKREIDKAIAINPNDAMIRCSYGVYLTYLGCYKEAEIELEKAVELEPQNAICHRLLGVICRKNNNYSRALAEAHVSIEIEPDSAINHLSLGVTLHEIGRYEEALKSKRLAIKLNSHDAEYHKSLEETLNALEKNYESAMKEEGEAILAP